MTIQFDPDNKRVRVGDRYFPAEPFPDMDRHPWVGKGWTIPLGESGKILSIAVGGGTYSDNYDKMHEGDVVDVTAEMNVVEVGFDFGESPSPYEYVDGPRGFDVTGYVDDEGLSRIIIDAMQGIDPF